MKTIWILEYEQWGQTQMVGVFEAKELAKQALIDRGVGLQWSVYVNANEEATEAEQNRVWTLYEIELNTFH